MTLQNNMNERLVRFLQAPPEVQALVDRIILEGKAPASFEKDHPRTIVAGDDSRIEVLGNFSRHFVENDQVGSARQS